MIRRGEVGCPRGAPSIVAHGCSNAGSAARSTLGIRVAASRAEDAITTITKPLRASRKLFKSQGPISGTPATGAGIRACNTTDMARPRASIGTSRQRKGSGTKPITRRGKCPKGKRAISIHRVGLARLRPAHGST